MEESMSSSRTSTTAAALLYGSGTTDTGAANSVDSGWTAYFDDFFQASNCKQDTDTDPAPAAREKLQAASTVCSSTNPNKKKVKVKDSEEITWNKQPPHDDLEARDQEDPLQDTASSSPATTQLASLHCRMLGKLLAVSKGHDQ